MRLQIALVTLVSALLTSSPLLVQAGVERQVNIKALPLGAALAALAEQLGLQVIYATDLVQGRVAPSVKGAMTAEKALAAVLADTHLKYEFIDAQTVMISAPNSQEPPTPRREEASPRRMSDRIVVTQAEPAQTIRASTTQKGVAAEQSVSLAEVIVTSTRQAEALSKVPESVAVLDNQTMQVQGLKDFQDVAQWTPGLQINQSATTGGNQVAIRGVVSNAGAATTGVYIDDVPIQVRQIGFSAGTLFPQVFDLERVEVLRGPQGTLFGASSEGGAVRFILPEASLSQYSLYARGEFAKETSGSDGGEAGVAFGGPLIQDTLGFRLSIYEHLTPGYVNLVTVNAPTVISKTGALGVASLEPNGEPALYDKDVNWVRDLTAHATLNWQLNDSFHVRPEIFYQHQRVNGPNQVQPAFSNVANGDFNSIFFPAAAPTAQNGLDSVEYPYGHGGETYLVVESLPIEWDLGPDKLYSTTSYVRQSKNLIQDITTGDELLYARVWPTPGARSEEINLDTQGNFTQEVRLQFSAFGDRLDGVAGAFFGQQNQFSSFYIDWNNFRTTPSFFGIPTATTPFGPQYPNYLNIWGTETIGPYGSGEHLETYRTHEQQSAVFAQLNFKATNRLTLTAGVRVSRNTLHYTLTNAGPAGNSNAPDGARCPAGDTCAPDAPGPFQPVQPYANVGTGQNAVTPKYSLNFQADNNNLFYVSASKGFRPEGAQGTLPTQCESDLLTVIGKAQAPNTYDSDSLWDYEVGAKNTLLDHRLTVDSSLYVIKWNSIQTNLSLPVCSYSFTTNATSATVKGFDFQAQFAPTHGVNLFTSVAYTDAKLDSTVRSSTAILFIAGSAIPGSGAPWVATLGTQIFLPFVRFYNPFIRLDAARYSAAPSSGAQVPGVFGYNTASFPNPAYTLVNARVGMQINAFEVSLFATNLFNEDKLLSLTASASYRYLYNAVPIAPRIIGVSGEYRF